MTMHIGTSFHSGHHFSLNREEWEAKRVGYGAELHAVTTHPDNVPAQVRVREILQRLGADYKELCRTARKIQLHKGDTSTGVILKRSFERRIKEGKWILEVVTCEDDLVKALKSPDVSNGDRLDSLIHRVDMIYKGLKRGDAKMRALFMGHFEGFRTELSWRKKIASYKEEIAGIVASAPEGYSLGAKWDEMVRRVCSDYQDLQRCNATIQSYFTEPLKDLYTELTWHRRSEALGEAFASYAANAFSVRGQLDGLVNRIQEAIRDITNCSPSLRNSFELCLRQLQTQVLEYGNLQRRRRSFFSPS